MLSLFKELTNGVSFGGGEGRLEGMERSGEMGKSGREGRGDMLKR
jgi:hypothetical protein